MNKSQVFRCHYVMHRAFLRRAKKRLRKYKLRAVCLDLISFRLGRWSANQIDEHVDVLVYDTLFWEGKGLSLK